MKRMILLALAASVIPACGGGGGGGSPGVGGPPPGPTVLLSDNWSSGTSPDWIIVNPTVTVDYGVGYGAPSMLVNAKGSSTPAVVQTVDTFNTDGGLTISMDIRLNTGSVGQFIIGDGGTTFASIAGNNTVFYISGQTLTLNYAPDSNWHTYTFIKSSGYAFWLRDGTVYFSSAFSGSWIYVDLRDYSSGTHFDNARITAP